MSPDQINQFFSFLSEGRIGEITFWLRLIAGVLTSAFLAAIVIIMLKFRGLFRAVPPPDGAPVPAAGGIPNLWQEVAAHMESQNPADWNFAVIRADTIVDGVLRDMGYSGATMGDRLKQLNRDQLASLDSVWEAHKLRNRIAHEMDQVLTYQEARRAVMLYGAALRELGYLKE